jgi:hypothetical protein
MAVDQERVAGSERRGMSRRDMIKAAGVAGIAAWTAPVIIDSLSSPAAADSVCNKYWVKVQPNGACFSACPGGGYNVSDAKWAGNCSDPGGCDVAGGTARMPTVSVDGDYLKVILASGCTFSSTTSFQIAGRYAASNEGCPGNEFTTVTSTCSGPVTGAGCYALNGNTAWVHQRFDQHALNGGHPADICYVYLKFCSTSP